MSVSGNSPTTGDLYDVRALMAEPLHPDLVDWVEETEFGRMLKHPLVYDLIPSGLSNKAYARKTERLAEARAAQDWHTAVFLHERPYRLWALIEHVTGRDEFGEVIPLRCFAHLPTFPATADLVADVWVDSENIEQNIVEWRALLDNGEGLWLGSEAEREEFDALPTRRFSGADHIRAYRGGAVGDWSWTTDRKVAALFSRRSGFPVREHWIPVSDVFGYLTRRSESELLVKFTDFRRALVYPT